MAIRKIVTLGDDVLRKECRKQDKFDVRLAILLKDMADTMYRAEGVGLAAPQVGVLRRVCVIDVGDGLVEMINPVITKREGEQVGREGCLSLPGRQGVVTRPMKVLYCPIDKLCATADNTYTNKKNEKNVRFIILFYLYAVEQLQFTVINYLKYHLAKKTIHPGKPRTGEILWVVNIE